MDSIASLCWTSRTQVCSRLVQFLRETPASPPLPGMPDSERRRTQRYQVARLLASLGNIQHAPVMRELLLDRREEFPVRAEALRWLSERRMPLTAAKLEQLLADPVLRREEISFRLDHLCFSLCSDEEGQAVARYRPDSEALLRSYWRACRPHERRKIVRWLQPAWDLVDKSWDLPGDEPLLRHLLAECAEIDPATLEEVLENLELPLSLLLEHVDAEALLDRIMQQIEAANQFLREKRWGDHTEAMERAYHLLRDWPDPGVDARIARMLCRPDPSPRPRAMLFWVLWDRNRDLAHPVARQVAAEHGDRELLRQSVRRLRSKPCPADRDFLLEIIADETESETLCIAVQSLERLGVDDPFWRQRLEALSGHSDPHVRLHAVAALARRGDEARLPAIIQEATGALKIQVRATALKLLGELDAERQFAVLRDALLSDHSRPRGFSNGFEAASAAATALARLGTPEAMTALLQACLSLDPDAMLAVDLCVMLARLAQEQEGTAVPVRWPWVGETGGLESSGMSAFEKMGEADQRVIGECLRAAAEGPFIPEWEFHILFGLYRWEVAKVAAAWPNVDDRNELIALAINNSMNNLLGYPIGSKERWPEYISVPPPEAARVLSDWRRRKGLAAGNTESEYFNCLM